MGDDKMSDVQLIQTPCVFGENGNFLLERELGRGGMGGVYLGRDKMLDRPVAVKVMLREFGSDAEFVERFKKEAQAAARLIHPNIAQVYSYGISDGMPYIAMELVAGGSLDQIMRNSGANSDIPRIMKICEQVAQALRCAADQGLVHGDIKPENILLDANGNAKIVDFGLAAMQHDTDEIWGTPYYIAPEKVRKDAVDYRADMYSLGGTLYHALCGVAPFEGDDAMTVVRKRFEFIPRKPSENRPELSPQIDALVMRMLAFNPGDRYPSFEALLADFKAVMTVGLSSSQILAPQGAPAKSAEVAASGKKKLTIKSKKKLSIRKPSETSGDDGDEEESSGDSSTGKAYNFKKMASAGSRDESDEESYEDEESGGNVGAKVAIFAGVLIGAILLVGGGLWGIKSYSENKDKESQKVQVQQQIDADVEYLKAFREKSLKPYKESVAKLLKDVVDDTKESFDKYEEIYSDTDVLASIKEIRQPKAKAPVADAVAAAPEQNAAAGNNADQKVEALPEKAENDAGDEQQAAAAEDAETPQVVLPPSLEKMRKLWGEMTSLKGQIEAMNKEIGDLDSKVDDRLSKIVYDDGFKKDLMDFVSEVKPYETSYSKKISELRKTSRGCIEEMKKICDQDSKRRTEEKEKIRREKERLEKEEQDRREKEEKEAARKALLERELGEAKMAFEDEIVQKHIGNLYWKGALDEIERKRKVFKTMEARIRVKNFGVKKIEIMQVAHKELVAASNGYEFKKGVFTEKLITDKKKRNEYIRNFAGKKVVSADGDKIVFLNKDGKGNESPYGWCTIYDKYPFIIKLLADKVEKEISSANRKAEFKLGLAMILKRFCLSVEGVEGYYMKFVNEVVSDNTYYRPLAEEAFPEIDFSKIEAEKAKDDV